MDIMTKEESYEDRRQLFKNIWDTAMLIDEKDPDNIMAKPKVIKTLRLDEMDKYAIGKRKKERIRNLRTVCKKILDFCDRQEKDETAGQKREIEGNETDGEKHPKLDFNSKKRKTHRKKKKTKRSKSSFTPKKPGYQATTSDRNDPRNLSNSSRKNSLTKRKRTKFSVVHRASVSKRPLMTKVKSNPDSKLSNSSSRSIAPRRKVMRKKHMKRKKKAALKTPGAPKTGRMIVNSIRQLLTEIEIEVT